MVHSGGNGTDFEPKLAAFHTDYADVSLLSTNWDDQVASDGMAAGGADFVTIASLAARQAFGGTQLCGTPDAPYLFLKEISSDGNVQTVDVIFPFHPILLYTNPTFLRYLLDPLFINQEAGQYPNMYSMHDLGSRYPNATGHPAGDDEKQPLEECGNMLIMTLAYAQRANDTAYLSKHYALLDQWTQYLIEEALIPANQISTDDFAGALAYVRPFHMQDPTCTDLKLQKKPDKSGTQRNHRHRSHGCNCELDRQYHYGGELYINSP